MTAIGGGVMIRDERVTAVGFAKACRRLGESMPSVEGFLANYQRLMCKNRGIPDRLRIRSSDLDVTNDSS